MVYDRESQSRQASESITAGWGGPQAIAGPLLVIPYRSAVTDTVVEAGRSVTRTREVVRELALAPEVMQVSTLVAPERRKRSIYEAVVYEARHSGSARFALPPDLQRDGIALEQMDFVRAELRFGISDPRGLGVNPTVRVNGRLLRLQPGGGSSGGSGFFAWMDTGPILSQPITVEFAYSFRGNGSLSLAPHAGETEWAVQSAWPHPSFAGDFLPSERRVQENGFSAVYHIGNLALGKPLVTTRDPGSGNSPGRIAPPPAGSVVPGSAPREAGVPQVAHVSLIQPVDLYSQVDRATKYGFLFIGFTFLALLMFDVIGGVRVSAVEYLLTGAALILFFVLLLALSEVIGFTAAYIFAAAAIAGLNTAYSAAVLKSWRRAWLIGALLVALYVVLYVLLSLEAFSLLIGSVLLFVALAGVMYATRRIDWSAGKEKVAEV